MADAPPVAGGNEGHQEHDPEIIAALLDTAGEPVRGDARLGGEMADSRSRHAAHDRLLIANLVDRSVGDADRARGDEQLAACSECALLYDDLVALSAATRALPVPARRRDFTLTNADADRLRVRGWRRVLAAIGSSRDVFSRPLAMGLTTLGVAGLLVATIPGALSGAASSPARQSTVEAARDAAGGAVANPESIMVGEASAAPPLASDSGPAIAAPAPSPTVSAAAAPAPALPEALVPGGAASPIVGEPAAGAADEYRTKTSDAESAGRSPMVVVASLFLLVGLGLFALRWTARRFGDA